MKNLKITVNGVTYDVQVEDLGGASAGYAAPVAAPAPAAAPAPVAAAAPAAAPAPAPAAKAPVPADAEVVCAPMPGTILSCNVKAGDTIKSGDVMFILEAMKMENEIMAPHDATVAAVHVNKGEAVESGTALVSLA